MVGAVPASGGVLDSIARTWAAPRRAMASRTEAGLTEGRALADLMLACGLCFVASLPGARRDAVVLAGETAEPVAAVVAAHAFAWIAVAPLAAYGIAALVHLVARLFGAGGGFLPARTALFAAMLAGTPIALVLAILDVLVTSMPGLWPLVALVAYAGVAFWLWLFSAMVAEAEGFRGTGRVALVTLSIVAGLAGLVAVMRGAGG